LYLWGISIKFTLEGILILSAKGISLIKYRPK